MKLEGKSALITGAAAGIGRAVALHLGAKGVNLSLVDFSAEQGGEAVRAVEALQGGGRTIFTRADVADPAQLAHAFDCHMATFGALSREPSPALLALDPTHRVLHPGQGTDFVYESVGALHICLNNAGIGERQFFLQDQSRDGSGQWRRVLDVDLTAVVDGTRLAIQAMQGKRVGGSGRAAGQASGGVVVNIASAAGLYPSANGPVYSAAKGGVVMFTRSLAHLAKSGVRVNALCPEFIDTGIVQQVSERASRAMDKVLQELGGFIPTSVVLEGVMELIGNDALAGECMWITNRLGRQWWPTQEEKARYLVRSGDAAHPAPASRASPGPPAPKGAQDASQGQTQPLPASFSKIIVRRLSTDFRAATERVSVPLRLPLPPSFILVRVHYAGINASDVNYSAGRYFKSTAAAEKQLPFGAGFEAVGVVAACGDSVPASTFVVGQSVALLHYGSFAHFVEVDCKVAIPVPGPPTREAVALLTSGLTASIALEQAARMGSNQTVLVTAAAGGTGQFAVQLAKLAGNVVVATCGSASKESMLKKLGADTVINYATSDVAEELKRLYPQGIDLVYESVGGKLFETCLNALAPRGRLIIIGMMSQSPRMRWVGCAHSWWGAQYTSGEGGRWAGRGYPGLCEKLLWKSQALVGFFLLNYLSHMPAHFAKLQQLFTSGRLKVEVDPRRFHGLRSVADAVDHLQSGKSMGKTEKGRKLACRLTAAGGLSAAVSEAVA